MQSEEYRRLYELSYTQPTVRTDWFMDHVYNDADLMMLHDERQRAVSALLLREYDYRLFGSELSCAYISGSCTHPQARGHGYAGQLLHNTLLAAADRGCALCAVTPPDSSQYFFYENYGFARAVFIDRQRYTALHVFPVDGGFLPAEVCYDDFHRLELGGDNTIIHSEADFRLVLDGLAADHGVAVAAGQGGPVTAMAFGVPDNDDVVRVRALYAEDGSESDGANAVLARLREYFGEAMMVVDSFPGRAKAPLEQAGMLRVLDVSAVLGAAAAARPDLSLMVHVGDRLIDRNNGYFSLDHGQCRRLADTRRPVALDVTVDVLARILCSSPRMAALMGLPGDYARLPLMY